MTEQRKGEYSEAALLILLALGTLLIVTGATVGIVLVWQWL